MAINLFKKQEEEKKEVVKTDSKKAATKTSKVEFEKNSEAWKILKFPHITEKAAALADENFYVFQVFPQSNKVEIKKAVENEYKVNVVDVKIVNIPRKKIQRGKISGFKNGYKKAFIRLKPGQKIDIIAK
ncbi:MAG: 50S ribosomal protein L23 [Candidatus Paceibacterota bacterium]|jgi:large subunit ribosomal protein L23